jgi:hypothetical protein
VIGLLKLRLSILNWVIGYGKAILAEKIPENGLKSSKAETIGARNPPADYLDLNSKSLY